MVILTGLFTIQQFGTGKVGGLFGPVVLLWFVTIGLLGIRALWSHPQVLLALSPSEGLLFLVREWKHAFPLLGGGVSGGDRRRGACMRTSATSVPGRSASAGSRWCCPRWCSTISGRPRCSPRILRRSAVRFSCWLPQALQFPLTLLATAAAIIASQALISGAFSLTTQAIQLGCLPRFRVRYTSEHSVGQVYVPSVNWMLAGGLHSACRCPSGPPPPLRGLMASRSH